MTSAPLSPQALNRAPLARQRLLVRTPLPATGTACGRREIQ